MEITNPLAGLQPFQTAGVTATRTVINKRFEAVAEADAIVPDSKADAAAIVSASARANITRREVQAGRVVLTGKCDFNVVYTAEDGSVCTMPVSVPFNHIAEEADLTDSMTLWCICTPCGARAEILNSRKILVSAKVYIAFQAYETANLQPACACSDNELEVRSRTKEGYCLAACEPVEFVLNHQLDRAVEDVLDVSCSLAGCEERAVSNKVVVKGHLHICMVYIDGGRAEAAEFDAPFTEVLDVPGVTDTGRLSVCLTVGDIYCEADDDGRLLLEVAVHGMVKNLVPATVSYLDDCYSPACEVEVAYTPMEFDEMAGELSRQTMVEGELPTSCPATRIISTTAVPVLCSAAEKDGRLCWKGCVDCRVLYRTTEDTVAAAAACLPFTFETECEAGTVWDAAVELLHCDAAVAGDTIVVRAKVSLAASLYQKSRALAVTGAEKREPICCSRPSVMIYVCREGDDLWSVAKTYKTTVADLVCANAMEEGRMLDAGMQLLIPR